MIWSLDIRPFERQGQGFGRVLGRREQWLQLSKSVQPDVRALLCNAEQRCFK